MFSKATRSVVLIAIVLSLVIVPLGTAPAAAQGGTQWCAGKTIRFFAGGAEGDAFASIVLRGILTARL